MLEPTAGERRALTVFFQDAAPQYRLYDWKTKSLKSDAEQQGVYLKNLEILRELVEKKNVELKRIETYCRFCKKEKRKVQWVNEVMPETIVDGDVLDRNLLDDGPYTHRLLVQVAMPVTALKFGGGSSVSDGEISVEYVQEFTMSQLVDRFCVAFGATKTKDSEKTIAGAFRYLLTSHTLDAVLYAIDYATATDALISSPLHLQDKFIPEAEAYLTRARSRRDTCQ